MPLSNVIQTLGQWGQAHPGALLWGAGGLIGSMAMLNLARRHRQGESTAMGSARWATMHEVRQAGLFAPHGVVLGRAGRQLLCDDSNTHILLCGPSRSGKGTSTIIPTLLTWRQSVLTLDPKDGENYDVTAAWRGTGSRVEAFTPCRAPQCCINVLDTIRLKSPHEFGDANVIALSLTAALKMAHESATGAHFRELAALLLTATILHVLYTSQRTSLAGVWDFLTQQRDLAACLQLMRSTAHTSHGVHQAIASMTTAIGNISGDRELSSVWTTAIRPLVLYSDPFIAASTDTSTITLEDLQYGPTPLSLYLIAPSPMALERLHPLYRVILDVALLRLMDHPVRTWGQRLLLVGDELPWYGYTRAIDKGIAVMAGYGIKSLLVTQDLPALEEVYGPHTAIWGNTDTKVFHSPTNDLTAKRISENLMGRGTVDHPVESRQVGMGGRQSVSYGQVGRPLLTTDEVMELDPRLEIVRTSGVKPILCVKVNYRVDREFQRKIAA